MGERLTMSKTKLEIIEETVEYIKENGRALGSYKNPYNGALKENTCVYRSENGLGCAVGRCIQDEKYTPDIEGFTAGDLERQEGIDYYLKEEYQGHNIGFWIDLQSFHDCGYYWNDYNELTEVGEFYLCELKEDYNENR